MHFSIEIQIKTT